MYFLRFLRNRIKTYKKYAILYLQVYIYNAFYHDNCINNRKLIVLIIIYNHYSENSFTLD